MTLTESLAKALTELKGSCPVGKAMKAWPAADVTWLNGRLADVKVPSDALSAAVAERSPRLASRDIANHRAGDCPCVIA